MNSLYCIRCGEKAGPDSNFCESCGYRIRPEKEVPVSSIEAEASAADLEQTARKISGQVKGGILQATGKINEMVGEEGNIDLNLRDVFSEVLKKHTSEEGELLFIAGTKATTPEEREISTSWPKPWLFSRVFLALALTYLSLFLCTYLFENINALPGLMMIGSFAVPFSLLVFFWETNAPRNISLYETAKMFFVGGSASLLLTLVLYAFFPVANLTFSGAVIVGVVEELGKLLVAAYFIKKLNPKYILNGLLIGAAIGAGFAAFETAGYVYRFGLMYGNGVMIDVIFHRAWTAVGAHVVWTAIAGAALVYVKGDVSLQTDHFKEAKFIKLFLVSISLHAIWDMPLYELQQFNMIYFALIITAWIFVFSFINAGLKQIARGNEPAVEMAMSQAKS